MEHTSDHKAHKHNNSDNKQEPEPDTEEERFYFDMPTYSWCSYTDSFVVFMDDCAKKKEKQPTFSIKRLLIRCLQILFFKRHCFPHNHRSQCCRRLTAPSFSLSFSPSFALSFSPPHQEKQFLLAKKKGQMQMWGCSRSGQNGRSVNEWQSILITRRGYSGSVCLISSNASSS